MSLIAKREMGTSVPRLEAGIYIATCYAIVDLGMQYSEKFDKASQKIQIFWNINNEVIKFKKDNEDIELPRILSKEYTMSLNEKSNLTRDLESWRGKKFTDEEFMGFDLENIINKGCQIQIVDVEKNGSTYSNIQSIMGLIKGMEAQKLLDTFIFSMNDKTSWNNWDKIPTWIQDKIKKATNYSECGLEEIAGKVEEKEEDFITVEDTDELPF